MTLLFKVTVAYIKLCYLIGERHFNMLIYSPNLMIRTVFQPTVLFKRHKMNNIVYTTIEATVLNVVFLDQIEKRRKKILGLKGI